MRKLMLVMIAVLALFTFLRDKGRPSDTAAVLTKAEIQGLFIP